MNVQRNLAIKVGTVEAKKVQRDTPVPKLNSNLRTHAVNIDSKNQKAQKGVAPNGKIN